MISFPLVKYVLTAALRDRLFHAFLALVVVAISLSTFLGAAAIVESNRFSLVFAAAGLRFAGVATLVLFVVFYLRRAFENKDVEYLLSRALSRPVFLLSHVLAFSLLALLAAVAVGAAIFLMAAQALMTGGYFLWALSLLVEFVIMANAALFFAFVLSSPTTATLAVFALYLLARLMGQILGIIDSNETGHELAVLEYIMQAVSLIVPRLDLMAQTTWLIYGKAGISAGFIVMQGIVYTFLLAMAALFDLARRQF